MNRLDLEISRLRRLRPIPALTSFEAIMIGVGLAALVVGFLIATRGIW